MSKREFEYNYGIGFGIFGTLLFSVVTAFLVSKALTNDKGLIIKRMIEFSAEDATIFYWFLVGISVIMLAITLAATIHNLMVGKQYLVIEDNTFTVPKGLFNKEKTINFQNIKTIQRRNTKGNISLTFKTPDGEAMIQSPMFKNKEEFIEATNMILPKCTNLAA